MSWSVWLPFFITTLVVSLSPGPGVLAAVSAGLQHGFARGHAVAYGLALGVWTQIAVIGVGLGALLAASAWAFTALQWVGAAYLVWLGVQQWRAPAVPLAVPKAGNIEGGAVDGAAPLGRGAILLRGWGINALNPKGTVFLLAMLPQFTDATQPLLPQYLVIALTCGAIEVAVMVFYAGLAARLQGTLGTARQMRWLNRGMGSLFIAAGTALAMFKRAPV
jgi:homoserine/homoserine lactone efflux protein